MDAFLNFCKFAGVLSGFLYISYFIENRKKKGSTSIVKASDVIPNFTGFEDAHRYFLSELHTGGIMVQHNDIKNGVKHLANAILVCSKPLELMKMLKSTMPIHAYDLVVQRLQEMHFNTHATLTEIPEESFDDLE